MSEKKKRKRGIRPLAAILFLLILTGAILAAGSVLRKKQEAEFAANEADMPEVQINAVMEQIRAGNYGDIYETTQSINPTMDSREAYMERLTEIMTAEDPAGIQAEPVSIEENQRVYQLVNGDTLLGTLTLIRQGDEWKPAFPIRGNRSFRVEVPSGVTLTVNGQPVGQDHLVETGKEAANFFQTTDSSVIPFVDIYEFDGLLGEPALNQEEGYGMIRDVLSGDWLMGKTVTDEALKRKLIDAAELIAKYPAQDTALANVTAVSDTSSAWYKKYVTLQNYWFTAHNTMNITNETIEAIAQSDDTIAAQISFDYFADNGEVSRTWHCGYQLTFRKSGDDYLVCGTEISSLLNPAQPH